MRDPKDTLSDEGKLIMNIANEILETDIDAAKLNAFVSKAQSAYKLYKTAAMESAANCYLLWHYAASEAAEDFARAWFASQLDNYNAEVDRFNNALPDLEARVAAYLADDSKDISAEEFAKIEVYLGYSKEDWDKAAKLKAEAREGASPFTIVVKFVFEFDRAADASNVSRYAKVLEYIHEHRDQLDSMTEDAIIALLKKAGGFEAALDIARGNAPENSISANNKDANAAGSDAEADAKRNEKVSAIKKAISHAVPVADLNYVPKFARDGYVFLIGRKVDDQVAIYGELEASENEAKSLVLKVDTDVLGGLNPFAEFAAKVCEIGTMVRDGKKSIYTADGTSSGEHLKVARTYVLRDDERGTFVQVSARYTDTSAVIIARPKPEIDIGPIPSGQFLMLPTERREDDTVTKTGKDLTKQVSSIGDRIMFGMTAIGGTEDAPLIWQIVPNGKSVEQCEKEPRFCWTLASKEKHQPVCIESFNAKFTTELRKTAVQSIYEAYIGNWQKAKKDEDKTFLPITLSYNGLSLSFEHAKHKSYRLPLEAEEQPMVTLALRPRDIADLFKLLAEQNTDSFVMKADPNGLLMVRWSDKFGEYEIYLPTVNEKGGLKDRCLTVLSCLI